VIYNPNIEYVAVEKLFLISNTENFWLNPYFCSEYEFYGTKPLNDDSGDDQRIFIVRPDDHVKRNSIKNFADIESFLLEKGFKILDPSRSGSLREQARIFNKAKVIVGEFSSSLHNAIFSRKGSQIIALNFVNDVQNQIAVMRGHKIGYIVPTRGPVHWADKEPYQLEMSDVRNAVEIATSHR
jgi:capsular polysaccharide biosynthesis protein